MDHLVKEKVVNMLNACEDKLHDKVARFRSYLSSNYGISPSTAISLILGGICLIMFVKRRWERKQEKAEARPQSRMSKSVARLYGGDLALRRLDEYRVAGVIPDALKGNDLVLAGLLEEEHLDLKKLQIVTARLEMAGEEDKGVKILKVAKKKNEEKGKSHHVYEIEMLLVELLIYLGRHDEALKCECLHQEIIELDARRTLFKAIIYGMQKNRDMAEHCWEEFIYLREEISTAVGQGQPLPKTTSFDRFNHKVQRLQNEIERKKNAPVTNVP